MDIINSIVAFIFAIGILVTVHEFGHFWVARRLGVKVLRFSIGFGRPLWRRVGRDGVEYVLAALPLGGYVKMLDEREGEVAPEERALAFNNKPLGVRFAVVLAGPAANFIFAVFAFWLMFMVGISGLKPEIATVAPGSIAEQAQLRAGDSIVAVAERRTATWQAVVQEVLGGVLQSSRVPLTVVASDGAKRERLMDFSGLGIDDLAQGGFFDATGVTPNRPRLPAVVAEVVSGSPADRAGFAPADRIVSADGKPMHGWGDWVNYVRARPNRSISATVERGGAPIELAITPEAVTENGATFGRVGIAVQQAKLDVSSFYAVERAGPLAALPRALIKTYDMTALTLRMLWKMVALEVSVKNLSGPISIAQYAGRSAEIGLSQFLHFLAIVSVSLGILNLLPIPVLDGGHLLYYSVEFFKGRPVSEETQMLGLRIGIAFLVALMGLAFYNDFARLLG